MNVVGRTFVKQLPCAVLKGRHGSRKHEGDRHDHEPGETVCKEEESERLGNHERTINQSVRNGKYRQECGKKKMGAKDKQKEDEPELDGRKPMGF